MNMGVSGVKAGGLRRPRAFPLPTSVSDWCLDEGQRSHRGGRVHFFRSSWRKRRSRYKQARRRTRRRESKMADGRARLQPPVVSSVRNGSGDS